MQTVVTVEEVPDVQGGYPVVAGTRTPVRTIVEMFFGSCYHDIDAIVETLTHLTREQVIEALDYYQAEPARVDEDFARHRHTLVAHLHSGPG